MGAPPFPRPPENDVYSESRKKFAKIVFSLLSGVKIKYFRHIGVQRGERKWGTVNPPPKKTKKFLFPLDPITDVASVLWASPRKLGHSSRDLSLRPPPQKKILCTPLNFGCTEKVLRFCVNVTYS